MLTSSCSTALIFALLVSVVCTTLAADCGQVLNSEVPRFTQFALFPNPVRVGEPVHARAEVTFPATMTQGAITGGTITLVVSFNSLFSISIPGIQLCNSSSAIACSKFGPGVNPINFDFVVPQIPAGTYNVKLTVIAIGISKMGCLTFDITVVDPSSTNIFTSWMEATLAGVAQFPIGSVSSTNFTSRKLGDIIQVGPIGQAPKSLSKNNQWGSFINVVGSEDMIDPDFSTAGYVWGLSGNMTGIHTLSTQQVRSQTYEGSFYLGYVSDMTKRELDSEILEGDFIITWTFDYDSSGTVTSHLTGNIYFDRQAVLPTGWRAPISIGRFGRMTLYTNSQGNIIVNGTKKYCLSSDPCDFDGAGVAPPGSEGLTDNDIGIMVALLVGIPLIAAMVGATLLYLRHKRRHEEEAGIFSAARKPEYGNALVIDDIIQESREHGGLPELERRPGDSESDDYSDDDDENEETNLTRTPRSGGRNNRRGRPTRSRSRSLSPPHSDSDDEIRRSPGRRRSMSGSDSDGDSGDRD